MALTTQQINQLVDAARADGASVAEIDALREYLIDRAAQMDGATRLDVALAQIDETERATAERFMLEFAQVRGGILARGADAVNGISDDEWERLINADRRS